MHDSTKHSTLNVDPILGEREIRQHLKALGKDVLVPIFRNGKINKKLITEVDIYYVMPDYHYLRRLDFLNLLELNVYAYYTRAITTKYFNSVKNPLMAYFRAWRFRRLYKSIKKNGIKNCEDNIWTVPWLFASRKCILRLDGSHRASIARYLGYKKIKVLLLTPRIMLDMQNIPNSYRTILNTLGEPEANLTDSSLMQDKL